MSMLAHFKNVLVLAPHTDDGELGAGGLISKLVENGSRVHYFAFSTADKSLPEGYAPGTLKHEVQNAVRAIGISAEDLIVRDYEVRRLNYSRQDILEELITLRDRLRPDMVLLPSLHDIHQDHTTIALEGVRAFKTTAILGYELIWNNLTFNTTFFVRLEKRHVEKKCEALKSYASQSGRAYMSREFVMALATARGVQIGAEYAEAFEVIRMVF